MDRTEVGTGFCRMFTTENFVGLSDQELCIIMEVTAKFTVAKILQNPVVHEA